MLCAFTKGWLRKDILKWRLDVYDVSPSSQSNMLCFSCSQPKKMYKTGIVWREKHGAWSVCNWKRSHRLCNSCMKLTRCSLTFCRGYLRMTQQQLFKRVDSPFSHLWLFKATDMQVPKPRGCTVPDVVELELHLFNKTVFVLHSHNFFYFYSFILFFMRHSLPANKYNSSFSW